MPISSSLASELTVRFKDLRVVVLGDLMLDHFIWGSVSRISPEAPVPVVRVTRESFHLGGSGNVACNLAALGAKPVLIGVTGTDDAGRHVLRELDALGAPRDGVLQVEGRATTKKTRIVAHAQQVVRFDREEDAPLSDEDQECLAASARAALYGAAALIVSDYEKGGVTRAILGGVLPEAERLGIPTVVDPKPMHFEAYRPITAVTPNINEASQVARVRIRDDADAARAAAVILEMLGCRAVLLTRGESGMLLCEAGAEPSVIPTAAREVYDVTGAGDTVVAAFTLALAAGASMADAAGLANAAAGVVVGKVGTATLTAGELERSLA